MAYLQREDIPFILRLRENQHFLREGYVALPISVSEHLIVGEKMIVKGSCSSAVRTRLCPHRCGW